MRVTACVFRFCVPLLCELRSSRFSALWRLLGAGAVDAKQPSAGGLFDVVEPLQASERQSCLSARRCCRPT